MTIRSSSTIIEFANPFVLPGSRDELPPGRYEVLVEEELLEGLSFIATRETAAYLLIYGKRSGSGPAEMRPTSSADVKTALFHDAALGTRLGSALPAGPVRGPDGVDLGEMYLTGKEIDPPKPSSMRESLRSWIDAVSSPLPH